MRHRGRVRLFDVNRVRLGGWLACFAMGILLGAVGTTVQLGRQVDALVRQRDRFEQQASELQARLQRLEESLNRQRRRPVRASAVRIAGLDPDEELELRRHVQELLQEFVGREVDQVDPALVARILDGRLITLGGRTVAISLTSVWVTDTLTVSVEVTSEPSR